MNILILSAQPPSPYSGGEIRLLNLIKPLSKKHEFTVIAPWRQSDQRALEHANRYAHFIPAWLPEAPPVHSRWYYRLNAWRQALLNPDPLLSENFYSPIVKRVITDQIKQQSFDLIQVQQLMMVQYLPRGLQSPSVLDVDNLWTKLLPRGSQLRELAGSGSDSQQPSAGVNIPSRDKSQRLQDWLDAKKVPRYEKRALNRFNACLAISHEDEQVIRRLAPNALTAIIPNGVDCEYFSNKFAPFTPGSSTAPFAYDGRPVLLFTGTMAWEPNADAAIYFSQSILPLIRQQAPDVHFVIAGRNPTPAVQKLADDPGITVTGFVEDIRPYLAGCTVFVAPIRAGAGSRLKILEALAIQKPVVSTTIGAEGLQVTPGKDILIADNPTAFAQRILNLIAQPDLGKSIAENGRKLVVDHYDWSAIAWRLDQVYQDISNNHQIIKKS